MSDSDLDKKMVYLAYRDIFKDKLAKLRKRNKVRNVVEKHKDHLHQKQLADSMDSEKTCRILGDLLAARLFESESAAKATFPTLFSNYIAVWWGMVVSPPLGSLLIYWRQDILEGHCLANPPKCGRHYYCIIFEHNEHLSTGPSVSPEHDFVIPPSMRTAGSAAGIDIAPAMDDQFLYQLFNADIETCNNLGIILGIKDSNLSNAQSHLAKTRRPHIGSFGQILEWQQEYNGNRHFSPLWGLYPGSQMTPLVNSTLSAAAKVLIDNRVKHGSGSTGWSRTWAINLYGRLFEADTAWNMSKDFIQKFPTANLWNTDSGPGTAYQIDANAIADIIYGKVNPSGRLPITLPKRELDIAANLNFKSARTKTYYEEGIWVGYRHFNARGIEPMYPFGHGLSYTIFEYSELTVLPSASSSPDSWRIHVFATVTNTGKVPGAHSVHFYTNPPPPTSNSLIHPEVTLQAFTKTGVLLPGESETVTADMDKYAISHWDELTSTWQAEPGQWQVKIGRDAQSMCAQGPFDVSAGFKWHGC